MKRKQKTLAQLKKKAWKLLSEFVRRKDADEGGTVNCYTCGALFFWRELDAGHAIGGRHGAVLFDESIIRPQCKICNIWKRGNYPAFTAKLIRENGLEWFEAKLAGARKSVKYTRADLEALIENYRQNIDGLAALRGQ